MAYLKYHILIIKAGKWFGEKYVIKIEYDQFFDAGFSQLLWEQRLKQFAGGVGGFGGPHRGGDNSAIWQRGHRGGRGCQELKQGRPSAA